jgi:transcriptional regulator with XRE-family HTH domain
MNATRVIDAADDLAAMDLSRTGNAIQRLRHGRSLSQQELADLVGADAKAVSRWERGLVTPRPALRRALADALGCEVEDLKLTLARPPVATKPAILGPPIAEVWLRSDGPRFTAMFVHADESTSSRPVAHKTGAAAQREITGFLVQRGYRPVSGWVSVGTTESTRKFSKTEGGEPQ